jgi:hypothetical protein
MYVMVADLVTLSLTFSQFTIIIWTKSYFSKVFTLLTKSCDQGNLYIVIGGEGPAGPMLLYTRPQT